MSTRQAQDPARTLITPAQCRAARAFLNWTQKDLAERSGVNERSIANFETEQAVPFGKTMAALHDCFTAAGVGFDSNAQRQVVSLRHPDPTARPDSA